MPLKLKPPRPGKTPYYSVRGTYLGCYIDRSTETSEVRIAKRFLKAIQRDIERGVFTGGKGPKGFAAGAASYMKAGGDGRFMEPIIHHFQHKPLEQIGQDEADEACEKLYPRGTARTRNRQLYTPLIAVLRYNNITTPIKRPIGWRSPKKTFFLMPEQAFKLLAACGKITDRDDINRKFHALNTIMLYCGLRLSEALSLERGRIYLAQKKAYLPNTKGGEPRPLFLTKPIIDALKNFPGGIDGDGRLFSWHKHGRLYVWLNTAEQKSGVILPAREAFHVWRHCYGTWMKQFGGVHDLTRTGAWSDRESAKRYDHTDPTDEAKKAALLPVPPKRIAKQ